jgi:Xaa-Pro aminopeptidase
MTNSPQIEFAHRRQTFLKALPEGSIAILTSAEECLRNGDAHYPYRQNSDFYYLTGFNEPEAVAVFIPGNTSGEFILFNRPRDPEKEMWDGPRAGQEGACAIYGADQAFPIDRVDQQLPLLLENRSCLYYTIARNMTFNRRVLGWISTVQKRERAGIKAPEKFGNIEKMLHHMRLYKSPTEIAHMQKAADISTAAHCRAMELCRPGMYEYALEAEIQYLFTKEGSRAPAYTHIVGAGANSCVLHYNGAHALIQDGDFVLIDAGAEYENYAADVTRTFPANGRFTPKQRAVYEAVLATQEAVIAEVKPGVPWQHIQVTSEQVMTEQLLKIGLLEGTLEKCMAEKACQRFYPHRIGHWLGMDVHDVGGYRHDDGRWRQLEAGMTFTVEPGIYIPAHSPHVDPAWWNMGVRIEDDILVTENGYKILSDKAPKTVEAIEALMAK